MGHKGAPTTGKKRDHLWFEESGPYTRGAEEKGGKYGRPEGGGPGNSKKLHSSHLSEGRYLVCRATSEKRSRIVEKCGGYRCTMQ